MRHEEKKIAKIVEEMTVYFFAVGADRITSDIKRESNQIIITIEANYQPQYKEKLDCLEEYLNEPKNVGVEDIYWELAGSGEPGESSQLLLVGMMLDKADIIMGEDFVKLTLYKELQPQW